jgi:hypothetical protein
MENSKGIFGKGNIKSSRTFHKAVRGLFSDTQRDKAKIISKTLHSRAMESSGLSREEAMEGLKKLKKEGKLDQEDLDHLDKHF